MARVNELIAGLKVLVVDDTATNRQLLQVFLKKLGCEVTVAENGALAVEAFERDDPDFIFMDVMMPVMDGYEATRRIKALCGSRWVPVIFLSALDKDENLVAGLEAGGDDYLAKPVNFVVLDAKLRSLARTLAFQRKLDESRRFIEEVTHNIGDCVITIDEQGRVMSANAVVQITFGYTPQELIGQNVSMLMAEPEHSEHDGYIRNYVRGGMPHIIGIPQRLVFGRHRDGTRVPVELTVTEMRFRGSRLFVGILRDVRERIAAEAAAKEHAAILQCYHDDREAENALAGSIMHRLMLREGLSDPRLHHWLEPATDFSGDIIAAARASDGRLFAMLADATGHGLAAAISVLPVLTSFYSMVENGFGLGFIAHEINRQLLAFMPAGRFVAASLVCFDEQTGVADLWVGGMPDLLLVEADGTLHRHIAAAHPPLGIIEFDEDMARIEKVTCSPGSQLVLISDGLIEAADVEGENFGVVRLARALCEAPAADRLGAVRAALDAHLHGALPHDDISILLIDC